MKYVWKLFFYSLWSYNLKFLFAKLWLFTRDKSSKILSFECWLINWLIWISKLEINSYLIILIFPVNLFMSKSALEQKVRLSYDKWSAARLYQNVFSINGKICSN